MVWFWRRKPLALKYWKSVPMPMYQDGFGVLRWSAATPCAGGGYRPSGPLRTCGSDQREHRMVRLPLDSSHASPPGSRTSTPQVLLLAGAIVNFLNNNIQVLVAMARAEIKPVHPVAERIWALRDGATSSASGGMGEVYLARIGRSRSVFQKHVVIKRLLPYLVEQPQFVEGLNSRAKLLVLLDHPNIVQVLDLGVEGSDYFMAMEYVHGYNLATIHPLLRAEPDGHTDVRLRGHGTPRPGLASSTPTADDAHRRPAEHHHATSAARTC